MKRRQTFWTRGFSPLLLFLSLALTRGLSPLPALLGEEPDTQEDTRTLTVAVAQFAISADVEANLGKMSAYIEEARHQGADLVLFSECCLTGYGGAEIKSTDEIDRSALARAEQELARLAREAGLFIVYGTTTFQDGGSSASPSPSGRGRGEGAEKPFNSLVFLDDKGKEVGRYHKVFVTPGDQKHYAGGSSLVVAEVRGVKVGLSICFDFRFPELYRWLAEEGAEVLLISFHQCTEWGNPVLSEVGPAHLASRAAENNCFVVAANKGAPKQWFSSRIYAPNGTLLTEAPKDVEHLLVQKLEMKQRTDWNARIAHWGLRALRTGVVPCGEAIEP